MKKIPALVCGLLCMAACTDALAQCTTANINWDELEYFHRNTAHYSTYVSVNMMQNQSFALGTSRMAIASSAGITPNGETNNHTADAGADLEFTTSAATTQTLTFTFDEPVANLTFSLYDIDNAQSVSFSALNGSGANNSISLSKPAGATVALSGTATAPKATGASSGISTASHNGTVYVSIAEATKSLTLSFGNAAGDWWLSDISACVSGTFANNYYVVSRPWSGPVVNQPGYVLAVHDLNTIYYVDPATGKANTLFTDPAVPEINNLAYDPVRRIVYYCIDGLERMSPAQDPAQIKSIKSYDVNTGIISTLIADVTAPPFNIPTFQWGMESGGAAFYDGALYVGVEGYLTSGTRNSGRESAIYRINFDANHNPVSAAQVFATPVDNGSVNIHDWADFVIKDGVLYDYNSAANYNTYSVLNMMTRTKTVYAPATSADVPKQAGQSWNGTLYWFDSYVGVFNGTNAISAKKRIVSAPGSVSWVGTASDGAEAYRPFADFGDAPATYEGSDPWAPAVHDYNANLRLGATRDLEWVKNPSANGYVNADADGSDEDGLAYVSLLASGSSYLTQVSVYNNTGTLATVTAWLDYNGNGIFEPSEGIVREVGSSSSMQQVSLYWPELSTPLSSGSQTYLRIRITSKENGMTVNHPTGYFPDGEVEDWPVTVDITLEAPSLLSFEARAQRNESVQVKWVCSGDKANQGFVVQRSRDGANWENLGMVSAVHNKPQHTYSFADARPMEGRSFYRLKLVQNLLSPQYSGVAPVLIRGKEGFSSLWPNPAISQCTLNVWSPVATRASVQLVNIQGIVVYERSYRMVSGSNQLVLDKLQALPNAIYLVRLQMNDQCFTRQLVVGSR